MSKFILIEVVACILLLVVPFFFGFKANMKKGSAASSTTAVLGIAIIIGGMIYFFSNETKFSTIIISLFLYVWGFVMIVVSPVFGVTIGLAEGKKFKGPYQKMTPSQRQVFWSRTRVAGKAIAGWVARDARRHGKHAVADAATYARKFL